MKIINKYKYHIFVFVLALIVLLITSKNSFLYVFNDWVDDNAFFTVGKGMFNGVVPYRDVFEQKGLLLYLIYGIGYLFSHTTFHGVFILEVLSFSIFLYYLHKIISMFYNEKYSFLILPIVACLLTVTKAFAQGGSCEEFCLPFMAVSLYYFIKHFKEKELTKKEIAINGLMAGCVLMMKYTILGFWIGFGLFIFIDYLLKKKYKESFMFCLYFLIGMIIPFIIAIIYLLIVGGVKEFIDDYFVINMTVYSDGKYGIIQRIIRVFRTIFIAIRQNGVRLFVFLAPLLILLIKDKNKYFKLSLIGLFIFTGFFIFWGLKIHVYYTLPLIFFIIYTFIGLLSLFKDKIDKIIDKKYMIGVFSLIFIGSMSICIWKGNFVSDINKSKNDYFQYKYAEYINGYEEKTLINMGFLDVGVYTVGDLLPNTKFFELQNIPYDRFPDNVDEMEKYVRNHDINFIVYSSLGTDYEIPEYVYENYEEVYKDTYEFEFETYTAYLFKLKGLEK